jgi:two-component system OmpR family sensor kinase/two-component system sensor histidine kinase BaeS
MGMAMSAAADLFLGQVNTALWQAALLAVALALVLGFLMARGLSAPLDRLAAAARRIAGGNLDLRVSTAGPIGGTREVAGLALAFNDMALNLQRAEQLRRDMVADIAHELRTPLTVLQGNLQAILDGVYPLDKSEVAAIHQETLVLSRLVGDLHELAQAEAGQLKLDVQPTDITALVKSVVCLFEEAASGQQIALEVDIPDRPLVALADADRTRQVIHNLLVNALQHTPSGGKITVQVARLRAEVVGGLGGPSVEQAHVPPGDSVQVSVLDTGSGLSPEDMPRVFDRLWRADRSRSRKRGGSGLGLAIARYLVEGQGGRIGVESQVGKGSYFWFTLPAVNSPG